MSSHNRWDDGIDLSFERSLKNWVDRKNPPKDLREQLLAQAATSPQPMPKRRRTIKFKYGWSLLFQGAQVQTTRGEIAVRPFYGYTFPESVFSLKSSMVVF